MKMRGIARIALAVAVAMPGAVAPARASAQSAAPTQWRVVRDPFADLWFHTMAVVGDQGFGVLPLYDVARARDARGRGGGGLDDARAAALRARLAADSALEILHFVPMYFVGVPPREALDALRAAASGSRAAVHGRAGEAARAVAAALPAADQRRTLLAIVSAADDEWRAILAPTATVPTSERPVAVAALDEGWQARFAPLLDEYLRASGQPRGVIVVSPAVGADGRVALAAPWGTVVAVGTFAGDPDAPLLAAVRELAYRAAGANAKLPRVRGRVAAARQRDALAVRAGALLLARDSTLASRYRALYRSVSRAPALSFEQLYPVDPATEHTLHDALAPANARR